MVVEIAVDDLPNSFDGFVAMLFQYQFLVEIRHARSEVFEVGSEAV